MRARTFRNILLFFCIVLLLTIGTLTYLVFHIYSIGLTVSTNDTSIVFPNFPDSEAQSYTRNGLPIVLSVFLLISMLAFGGLLYYFYRQRYWNGMQKEFV